MCILIVLTHLKSLVPIYKRHAFYLDIFKYLFRGQNRPECIVRLNHTWGFIMSHQLWMSNFCWMKFSCLIVVYWLVLSILCCYTMTLYCFIHWLQLTFSVFLTDLRPDVSHPLVQLGDDGRWSEKLQDFNGNGSAYGLLEPDSGPLGLYPSTPGRPQKDLPHNHRPQ